MQHSIPQIGDLFEDKYKILEKLGVGGTATVYRAEQTELRREVALKVLNVDNIEDSDARERFMKEARLLSLIRHPNIITVYQLAISESGLPYLVLELVKGRSLKGVINREGPLSLERALELTRQCCLAMQFCHNAGVIHRDISSQNIILIDSEEKAIPKIIDFGIAKIQENQDKQNRTATGILMGTATYMSPEQAQGKRATTKSDIYALGVCLYEMLTGTVPFQADNPIGLLYKQIHEQQLRIKLSIAEKEVNNLIARAMAKNPDDRFESMVEFANAIAKISSDLANGDGTKSGPEYANHKSAVVMLKVLLFLAFTLALLLISKASISSIESLAPLQQEKRGSKHQLLPKATGLSAQSEHSDFSEVSRQFNRLLVSWINENNLGRQATVESEQLKDFEAAKRSLLEATKFTFENGKETVITGRLYAMLSAQARGLAVDSCAGVRNKVCLEEAWSYGQKACKILENRESTALIPANLRIPDKLLPSSSISKAIAYEVMVSVISLSPENHGTADDALKYHKQARAILQDESLLQRLTIEPSSELAGYLWKANRKAEATQTVQRAISDLKEISRTGDIQEIDLICWKMLGLTCIKIGEKNLAAEALACGLKQAQLAGSDKFAASIQEDLDRLNKGDRFIMKE